MTSAVVLNYRTPDRTIATVRSLFRSHAPLASVIVVDNGSGDDSVPRFRSEIPEVMVLQSDTNGGFSAGCNFGIKVALKLGAERVLVANSDITLSTSALGALGRALDANPALGIVGPVVLSEQPANRVESIGMRYSTATGRMRHDAFGAKRAVLLPFKQRAVDGVSGCAMLVDRRVFDQIGFFTEEYFFGFEDLDFCLRAREAGFETACVGTATAVHEGNASIGRRSARRIYFATRNHLLLASRRAAASDSVIVRAFRAAAVVTFNLAHVLVGSDVPRHQGLPAVFRGLRDHLHSHYGSDHASTT